MPAALDRLIRRLDPDPAPEPPGYTNPNHQPEPDPDCICHPEVGVGRNPTCTVHGWWNRDAAALDLADLTRELGSALAAARQKFGDGA